MRLTKKTMYPAYPVQITSNVALQDPDGSILFRTHEFDKPDSKNLVKKWRKDDLQSGDGPLCGLLPLRSLYYHANESKIPATTRMGIKN